MAFPVIFPIPMSAAHLRQLCTLFRAEFPPSMDSRAADLVGCSTTRDSRLLHPRGKVPRSFSPTREGDVDDPPLPSGAALGRLACDDPPPRSRERSWQHPAVRRPSPVAPFDCETADASSDRCPQRPSSPRSRTPVGPVSWVLVDELVHSVATECHDLVWRTLNAPYRDVCATAALFAKIDVPQTSRVTVLRGDP
jgi:hypothetical protein